MKNKERQSLILEKPKEEVPVVKYFGNDNRNRYFYTELEKCVKEASKNNFKKYYSYLKISK